MATLALPAFPLPPLPTRLPLGVGALELQPQAQTTQTNHAQRVEFETRKRGFS